MNIRHLETFVSVVKNGSFSKAAQELYTTPTALTQQINTLERQLGTPLLVRDWRGASPTEAGTAFLTYARDIIELAHRGERAAQEAAGLATPTIRIGSYRNIALVQLQQTLLSFRHLYPNIRVSFVNGDYHNFHRMLTNDELDLYLFPRDQRCQQEGIGFQKLSEARLSCNLAFDHPLAARSVLTPQDLEGHDIIVSCGCGSNIFEGVEKRLHAESPHARLHKLATDDDVWSHVLTQGWILINFASSAAYVGSCDSIPLEWPQTFDFGFVYRTPCDKSIQTFLDHVASTCPDSGNPEA